MTVVSAKEQPVHLVLSGPAGGVIGATALGRKLGYDNLITIDMGGTSLDASLIAGGHAKIETEQSFQTLPVSIPTIDIHTIGAAAGASPGSTRAAISRSAPRARAQCLGLPAREGGDQATFTDAALAVGYLDPENFLGGEMRRSIRRSRIRRSGSSRPTSASRRLRPPREFSASRTRRSRAR